MLFLEFHNVSLMDTINFNNSLAKTAKQLITKNQHRND